MAPAGPCKTVTVEDSFKRYHHSPCIKYGLPPDTMALITPGLWFNQVEDSFKRCSSAAAVDQVLAVLVREQPSGSALESALESACSSAVPGFSIA